MFIFERDDASLGVNLNVAIELKTARMFIWRPAVHSNTILCYSERSKTECDEWVYLKDEFEKEFIDLGPLASKKKKGLTYNEWLGLSLEEQQARIREVVE